MCNNFVLVLVAPAPLLQCAVKILSEARDRVARPLSSDEASDREEAPERELLGRADARCAVDVVRALPPPQWWLRLRPPFNN